MTPETEARVRAGLAAQSLMEPGRRLVVVTAGVCATDGPRRTKVAVMQGTMVPVPPQVA